MASFTDYITVEGERMLAKAVAGTSVSFTKIVIGSGYMSSGAYEKNIKEVITPEVELPVQSVSVNSSDSVLITSRFTNKDIEHGFFLREKAVYMSDGNDEVLAIYGNNGSSAEFIDTAEVCVVDKTIKSVVKLSTQELANIHIVDDNYEFAPQMEPNIKSINDFVKTTAALAMRVGQRVIINQWTAYTYIGYDPTDASCYITGANVLSDVYNEKLTDGTAERGVGASQNALYNVYGIASKTAEGLSAHLQDKSNPHGVTKSQVGLGNVPNVSTNDQTPTYSAAGTLATLTSGEKLSVSFGKIMKAITELIGLKEDVSDLNSNLTKETALLKTNINTVSKNLTKTTSKNDVTISFTSGVSIQAGHSTVINGVFYSSICIKLTKSFSAKATLFTVRCSGKTLVPSGWGYDIGKANGGTATFVFDAGKVYCESALDYTKDAYPVFTLVVPFAFAP